MTEQRPPDVYNQTVVQPRRKPQAPPKTPRSIVMLAVLGLISAVIASVAALAYDVIVRGGDTAALVSIASIAVGALASIGGGVAVQKGQNDRPPNQ